MLFLLICVKKHDTLDLYIDTYPRTEFSPHIFDATRVGQSFTAMKNNLARIDVSFRKLGQTPTEVQFNLYEMGTERKIILKKRFNTSRILQNKYNSISFKPLRRSKGKKYLFVFYSPDSTFRNSLQAWINNQNLYKDGEYFLNNQAETGDLVFRVYYKRPIITELGRITRNYPGIFHSTVFLIFTIVFFIAVQILVFSKLLDFIHIRVLKMDKTEESVPLYDILVISDDVAGEKMAAPGIRAWEIAKCLAKHFKVILAVPDYSEGDTTSPFYENLPFELMFYSVKTPSPIIKTAQQSRILLIQGYVLSKFPKLKSLSSYLICDMWVPYPLENLFTLKLMVQNQKDRNALHLNNLKVYNDQVLFGDHFLLACERQRDMLTGLLLGLNRINPEIVESSPNLDELMSIVHIGLTQENEKKGKEKAIRTAYPQIKESDVLFFWGGVVSAWYDPNTLLHAFKEATKENQNIKLFFIAKKHPNPLVPELDMVIQAEKTAEKLNLLNRYVFFHENWVEYKKRSSFFQDADVGISIHKTHLETRFSFRTRILDYLKFDLPIICTEGDFFGELVEREKIGFKVGSEKPEELKKAILTLAENTALRKRIKGRIGKIKKQFYWEETTRPLIEHCRDVLAGRIDKKKTFKKSELVYVTGIKKEKLLKKLGKNFLWKFWQKLPLPVTARLRRLLKF